MYRVLITAIFVLWFGTFYAHEISGTVVAEDDSPLEGIGVYNKGNGGYTYSNISGYFELDGISEGDIILFYGLGFKTEQLIIGPGELNGPLKIVLTESAVSLDQVVLVSKVNILSQLADIDVKTDPVKSSQEILRKIPGLVIGQHAGGGKAEQIFLRGFDIDHGTDIAISVDGMPVNLVSHAHGQGYADMHFIIPETINSIDFGKGPFYANKGNFNTAGYVTLNTMEQLDENQVKIEAGQYNTMRLLNMFKILDEDKSAAYVASEILLSDGVFDAPQNFNRLNLMGRYSYNTRKDSKYNLSISHFQSNWDASGQIPQRAVEQGIIGRFGAIDNTEGGTTSRSNLWLNFHRQIDEHRYFQTQAFLSRYNFELFSNFTFFLEDPENGDQIRQAENRYIFGFDSRYGRSYHLEDHGSQLDFEIGSGFRYDDVDEVQLSRTLNRKTLINRLAYGNTDEFNAFGYGQMTFKKGKWTLNPGLRLDYLRFYYQDILSETYSNKTENKLFVGPKFNVIYSCGQNWQLFAKTGYGFHSNDTRVVIANEGLKTLPGAFGTDLGLIGKPFKRVALNLALWSLFLEQEFVYVGDAGIVEPSGRTRRFGTEMGIRYQIADWLFVNGDLNYTYARSSDEPDSANYIPLAPDLISTGGVVVKDLGDFSGALSFRYVGDRPANEDGSIVAEGYFVTDFNLNYQYRNWTLGLIIENLLDTEWNETQFATESRLFNENQAVEEIHFTPGVPFFLRAKLALTF